MKKNFLFFAFFVFLSSGSNAAMPTTSFYLQQIEALENVETSRHDLKKKTKLKLIKLKNDNPTLETEPESTEPKPSFLNISSVDELVKEVINLNEEAESRRQKLVAARFNLNQTQAIEPVISQFAGFMQASSALTPMFKEHPFPGVSALKLRIAQFIEDEAEARLQLFLADLARKARLKAFQYNQIQKKIDLTSRTIELYLDLKNTSESLYRNGKISFSQLTMVSVEAQKHITRKNSLLANLAEIKEKLTALLDGHALKPGRYIKHNNQTLKVNRAKITEKHPEIAAENSVLHRNQTMIELIKRASFPEFTTVSSIPGQKLKSIKPSYSIKNHVKDSNIEYSRVFVGQLQAKTQAQNARLNQVRKDLNASLSANKEALKQSERNLNIISSKMIPELEKAFESVKSRYESGQAGFQELVETESRLLNFKNLQIDAEFETLKLKADIIFDLGKIFPEQES
jgi:outer membrane protein TolC